MFLLLAEWWQIFPDTLVHLDVRRKLYIQSTYVCAPICRSNIDVSLIVMSKLNAPTNCSMSDWYVQYVCKSNNSSSDNQVALPTNAGLGVSCFGSALLLGY